MNADTPAHDSAQSHEHTHYTFAQLTEMHSHTVKLSIDPAGEGRCVGARLQLWINLSFPTINNSIK